MSIIALPRRGTIRAVLASLLVCAPLAAASEVKIWNMTTAVAHGRPVRFIARYSGDTHYVRLVAMVQLPGAPLHSQYFILEGGRDCPLEIRFPWGAGPDGATEDQACLWLGLLAHTVKGPARILFPMAPAVSSAAAPPNLPENIHVAKIPIAREGPAWLPAPRATLDSSSVISSLEGGRPREPRVRPREEEPAADPSRSGNEDQAPPRKMPKVSGARGGSAN